MAVSFEKDIKPYFTSLDREHMNSDDYYYDPFDLWSATQVCERYEIIRSAIMSKHMPPEGEGEGPWPDQKIATFVDLFEQWKKGGCQP